MLCLRRVPATYAHAFAPSPRLTHTVFKEFDRDGSGTLDWDEFRHALRVLHNEMSSEKMRRLFRVTNYVPRTRPIWPRQLHLSQPDWPSMAKPGAAPRGLILPHREGLLEADLAEASAVLFTAQVFDVDDNGRVDHREFSSLVFPDLWGLDPGGAQDAHPGYTALC